MAGARQFSTQKPKPSYGVPLKGAYRGYDANSQVSYLPKDYQAPGASYSAARTTELWDAAANIMGLRARAARALLCCTSLFVAPPAAKTAKTSTPYRAPSSLTSWPLPRREPPGMRIRSWCQTSCSQRNTSRRSSPSITLRGSRSPQT